MIQQSEFVPQTPKLQPSKAPQDVPFFQLSNDPFIAFDKTVLAIPSVKKQIKKKIESKNKNSSDMKKMWNKILSQDSNTTSLDRAFTLE